MYKYSKNPIIFLDDPEFNSVPTRLFVNFKITNISNTDLFIESVHQIFLKIYIIKN